MSHVDWLPLPLLLHIFAIKTEERILHIAHVNRFIEFQLKRTNFSVTREFNEVRRCCRYRHRHRQENDTRKTCSLCNEWYGFENVRVGFPLNAFSCCSYNEHSPTLWHLNAIKEMHLLRSDFHDYVLFCARSTSMASHSHTFCHLCRHCQPTSIYDACICDAPRNMEFYFIGALDVSCLLCLLRSELVFFVRFIANLAN